MFILMSDLAPSLSPSWAISPDQVRMALSNLTGFHAKQMFFPTPLGGEFAVIDWQFPFVAQGAWGFARMLGMCIPADEAS